MQTMQEAIQEAKIKEANWVPEDEDKYSYFSELFGEDSPNREENLFRLMIEHRHGVDVTLAAACEFLAHRTGQRRFRAMAELPHPECWQHVRAHLEQERLPADLEQPMRNSYAAISVTLGEHQRIMRAFIHDPDSIKLGILCDVLDWLTSVCMNIDETFYNVYGASYQTFWKKYMQDRNREDRAEWAEDTNWTLSQFSVPAT